MSDTDRGVIYQFGPFQADPLKRQWLREGKCVQITAKAFDTLLILVTHSGDVVSKTELMDAVWSDAIVEENNLTQQISALRKALGERPSEHKFIVTIPGRGYTFIAPVKEVHDYEASSEEFSPSLGTANLSRPNHLQTLI